MADNSTIYKDLILDTLKSKNLLGTDSNGKIIDGETSGLTQDVTVRNAAGDGTTTLTFKNGLLTGVA